jgi:2-haloalkanoic acid dehalogenase type II
MVCKYFKVVLRVGLVSDLNPQWSPIPMTAATLKDIRTITLDLDDTLWEIHPVIRRAEKALYEWLGENYPRITQKFQAEDMRALRNQVVAEFPDQIHDLTFLRRTVLSRAGSAVGYDDSFIDSAFAVFDAVRNDVQIFPGVIPALAALKERYVVIAVTNGNANLEAIGIAHLFDEIVTAATAGAAKPARQVFDLAVELGGASPAQTLHVGDHPEFDVDGARNAGLRTVWVNRNEQAWPDQVARPDIEVVHVSELPLRLPMSD